MAQSQPVVAHQFDDLKQQHDSDRLGMWVFLGTEVMFFGALFGTYLAYRYSNPAIFAAGSRHLDVLLGTINTAVLLCSSLAMAFAVYFAEEGKRERLLLALFVTMGLGLLFIGIKGLEYYHEYREHLIPALDFAPDDPQGSKLKLFFVLYFVMTGLHALHLTIGVCLVGLLAVLAWRGRIGRQRHVAVELIGLYWHFVDIVWVFVYPLLYLIDRRGR